MRKDIINRKSDVLSWVLQGETKTYMCEQLKCKPDTLNSYLNEWGVEYKGNQFGKGLLKSKKPLEDILTNKVSFSDFVQLKKRLIYMGIIEDKCDECSLIEWNGKPITLELEHINGDNKDNSLDNIRLLCPNCHSQTPTFRKKKSSLK